VGAFVGDAVGAFVGDAVGAFVGDVVGALIGDSIVRGSGGVMHTGTVTSEQRKQDCCE
jgi:hypothetical protein